VIDEKNHIHLLPSSSNNNSNSKPFPSGVQLVELKREVKDGFSSEISLVDDQST